MDLEVADELPPIKPVRTKHKKKEIDEEVVVVEESGMLHTPTSEDCILKPLLICPPAPRKKRPQAKHKLSSPAPSTTTTQEFFDLTSVFVAVGPSQQKKIKQLG